MEGKLADMATKRTGRRTLGKGAAVAAGTAAYVAPALTRLGASVAAAQSGGNPPPPGGGCCGTFTGHANFSQVNAAAGTAKSVVIAMYGDGVTLAQVQAAGTAPLNVEVNLDCCAPGTGGNFNAFYNDSLGNAHHFHATSQLFAGGPFGNSPPLKPLAPTVCNGAPILGGGGPVTGFRTITGWVRGTLDGGPPPGNFYAYFQLTDNTEANATQDDVGTIRIFDAAGNLLASVEQAPIKTADGNLQAHGLC